MAAASVAQTTVQSALILSAGMISSNDFRTGTTIELDGQVWRVVEFLHVKPGKGSAFVRTYMEAEEFVFMDMASFEETRLTAKQIGDGKKYLKEGMEVSVVAWNGKPIEVELPNSVVLEVTQTDPGVKGDTATGGTKPAIVETGAQVMVPLFITIGEKIKIDTRSDTYLGRES